MKFKELIKSLEINHLILNFVENDKTYQIFYVISCLEITFLLLLWKSFQFGKDNKLLINQSL